MLLTRFGREIDYRVVSVAYCDPAAPATDEFSSASPLASVTANAVPSEVAPAPMPSRTPLESSRELPPPTVPAAARADRIRFVGVNLFVSGPRTQAQVELRWRGLPRMGSASGWSTRDGANRLIAQATLAALQEFLSDEIALAIEAVQLTRAGRRRVVLVTVALVAHREEKLLSGSCVAEHDLQQAVVLATLSAVNRLVGGLRTKEPTEYVLRPTST